MLRDPSSTETLDRPAVWWESQPEKAILESLPRLGSDRVQARSYSGFVEM